LTETLLGPDPDEGDIVMPVHAPDIFAVHPNELGSPTLFLMDVLDEELDFNGSLNVLLILEGLQLRPSEIWHNKTTSSTINIPRVIIAIC
jgi:hypothetical protein